MVARHALIVAQAERVQIPPVPRPHDVRHILPPVVGGPGDRLRRGHGMDGQRRRRNGEPLVHVHLRADGMVHGHQLDFIKEVRFPQVRRDAQVVKAVPRLELVAPDFDPVARLHHARRVLGVDPQAQWRAPDEVGDELHARVGARARAVVGQQPGAGAFQPLRGFGQLVGLQLELALRAAVGPDDADAVRALVVAQAEMRDGAGNDLRLIQQSRPQADLAADAIGVVALVALPWRPAGALPARRSPCCPC